MTPMRITFVSSEMVPLVKVGGLADVVGALSGALKALGHQVRVCIPCSGSVDPAAHCFAKRLIPLRVAAAGTEFLFDVFECRLPSGVEVLMLRNEGLMERGAVYTDGKDEELRFGVFCRASAALVGEDAEGAEIVHCHDWPAALVPYLVKRRGAAGERGSRIPTVMTIHNIAHQGIADKGIVPALDLDWNDYTAAGFEYFGKANLLKAGLVSATAVTTVSPNYAREVLTPEGGAGLDGVMRSLGRPLRGILNGIDTAKWNPAADPAIAAPFTPADPAGKVACKAALQKELGLDVDPTATLAAVVARLTHQKGIDLVLAVLPRLLRSNVQVALLGEGQKDVEERVAKAAKLWKGRMASVIAFDEPLSHRFYAGSDLFLVPSRFEPCGLSAMIAMRYGSVCVARATGGLVDTVVDADRSLETGSGFVFDRVDAVDFLGALLRAVSYHQSRKEWGGLVRRVMGANFSWETSAKKYEALYRELKTS